MPLDQQTSKASPPSQPRGEEVHEELPVAAPRQRLLLSEGPHKMRQPAQGSHLNVVRLLVLRAVIVLLEGLQH